MFSGTDSEDCVDGSGRTGAPGVCGACRSLWLKAPAKINLYLEILGRRDNGYHDIRTVIAPISLYDVVHLELTGERVETIWLNGRDGDDNPVSSDENLTTRAAVLLKELTGSPGGVRIHLKKAIPVGGGLGGGSADAAAVLIGLNTLWRAGLGVGELMDIGFKLGCDVPSMVHGGVVCSEGLGEEVSAVKLGPGVAGDDGWRLILVNPGFSVSTADIYARCRSSLTSGGITLRSMLSALSEGDLEGVSRGLFNGLQETVFAKYPLIAMISDGLMAAGARGVLLSGSGSTVFGLALSEENARETAGLLPDVLGFPVRSDIVSVVPDGVMVAHGPLEA